jgi:ABC-type dipeptide/oligopeptide/nickel transport system permease component
MHFIGKRLAVTVLTLFLVSLFTFLAFRLIPGDAAILAVGTDATEEQLEVYRTELGLDRSLPVQYLGWLKNFLTGNLGASSRFRGSAVSDLIADRLPVTFHLAFFSLVFIVVIAVPASFIGVKKEDGPAGQIVNVFTALNISMPGFFLGVLLIWIFGLVFRLFTPGAYIDYRENYGAFLGCLVFPALAIALPNAAILVKFLRSSILKEFDSDSVRTARSKGLSRNGALFRHVVKNASLPAVTIMGMILGEVFSGSIVIEQVFTIPGIGRLLIAAITSRDYPMAETLIVYIAFVVILGNTLVDIVIRVIDPRIAGDGRRVR